jgi:hypothetical protein
LPAVGGFDFAKRIFESANTAVLWTVTSLPTVTVVAATPDTIRRTDTTCVTFDRSSITAHDDGEHLIRVGSDAFHVHMLGEVAASEISAVLPMDDLFDVRLAAARRLWLALNARKVPTNPARLTKQQRDRYVLALRALDGKLANASYREIAAALFGAKRVEGRGWKTHDLRDRTIGLWELGRDMMEGGYRQLLVYHYRKRL